MQSFPCGLQSRLTPGAQVVEIETGTWRLQVPGGGGNQYRLAQLDDYAEKVRSEFKWHPPLSLSLLVRVSGKAIPGTWGFGFWNDPFSMAMRGGGGKIRLPALPNAAWIFHASAPNYLTLEDDLPARGWYASIYRSNQLATWVFGLGLFALPLLLFPPAVRLLRRFGRRFVQQDGASIDADPTEWQHFKIDWRTEQVIFNMDGEMILETDIVPGSPLGFVMWIDNQFAAIPPSGRVSYGTLAHPDPAWLEVKELRIASM